MRKSATRLTSAVIGLVLAASAAAQTQCPAGDNLTNSNGSWGTARPIMYEDFESGDLSGTSASGFSWDRSVRMSVVRDDETILWESWNSGETGAGANWTPFSGRNSLRFGYPAGANGWAEQRFTLGGAYPELWIGYWLRVPENWRHGTGTNSNNKFFAIWMDRYEEMGPTGVIQTRNSNGSSIISPYVRDRTNDHQGEDPGKLLIDINTDRGRWMQVVIHVKMASGEGVRDGLFELYRRWQGENQFEQIFGYNDWDNYHVGGNRGFAQGYILGWANADQPASYDWLLDEFIASEDNLIEAVTSAPASSPSPAEPTIPNIILP